jgi:hypothetical protein
MGILELKEEKNLYIHYIEKNSTSIDNDDIFYHKNYLYLLLIITLAFFVICYYMYLISRIFFKKAKAQDSENTIIYLKYSNLQNLSVANFIRGLSLVYIIISYNKNADDVISFINYIVHVFPALLFYSAYLTYARFLIEKYYEIKTKKNDIFFSPTIQFFNIFMYVVMSVITLSCLSKYFIKI